MMLEKFKKHFLPDSRSSPTNVVSGVDLPSDVANLLAECGGSSFNGGLYRLVRLNDLNSWASCIGYAFPEFKGRIVCFGYDWLGSVFATDAKRLEGGRPGVIMFEPGTGQALKIPANIETFHDDVLINFGEAALAIDFYRRWRKCTEATLAFEQCAGYIKPLFLGGIDDLENLEISDIDVYWHIMGQLILKTKGLPVGTPIRTNIS
jgi:Domain of unknown function (DUF1851)